VTSPGGRRYRWLSLAVALLVTAGCGAEDGSGPGHGSAPVPSPVPYAQAVELVPIDGSAERPLHWELDLPADPELAAAVTAVQHYEATWQWLLAQPTAVSAEQLSLLDWFSLPEEADRQRDLLTASLPSSTQLTGPRWIRLLAVESERAGEALVVMCVDTGWYTEAGVAGEPRSPDRADVYAYQVVRRPAPDGVERWRVQRSAINPMHEQDWFPDDVSTWHHTCAQWATHAPDDA